MHKLIFKIVFYTTRYKESECLFNMKRKVV